MSYKGADYRKADLQIHSPRDEQWQGGRPDDPLPANALAEDILEHGRILQIGAIDLELLRDSITETMEGGKGAFELRRRKYNF